MSRVRIAPLLALPLAAAAALSCPARGEPFADEPAPYVEALRLYRAGEPAAAAAILERAIAGGADDACSHSLNALHSRFLPQCSES